MEQIIVIGWTVWMIGAYMLKRLDKYNNKRYLDLTNDIKRLKALNEKLNTKR